jgi:hypothetical protein
VGTIIANIASTFIVNPYNQTPGIIDVNDKTSSQKYFDEDVYSRVPHLF